MMNPNALSCAFNESSTHTSERNNGLARVYLRFIKKTTKRIVL